jgi:hypothetical protein
VKIRRLERREEPSGHAPRENQQAIGEGMTLPPKLERLHL